MTPEQKIKHVILMRAINAESVYIETAITADNVDELFDENNEDYELQDFIQEFRSGEVETKLRAPFSRHYESKAVAAKMPDGSWVGWTYWYGGGKHGEPEAVEWIGEAYELNCTEEERVVLVREFSLKD